LVVARLERGWDNRRDPIRSRALAKETLMRFGLVHHSLGHGIPVEQAIKQAYDYGARPA